ncbi:MAG: hypothetical protein IIB82_03510 [Bacteroidetes bacterium]|nr:hypothetical protein [Bacteroidota bacterium]
MKYLKNQSRHSYQARPVQLITPLAREAGHTRGCISTKPDFTTGDFSSVSSGAFRITIDISTSAHYQCSLCMQHDAQT